MVKGFDLPSNERFDALCKDLKLNDDQRKKLLGVLYRAHVDLKEIFRAKLSEGDRKSLMRQLKKFQFTLDQLLKVLRISPRDIARFREGLHFALGTPEGVGAASRMTSLIAGRRGVKAVQSRMSPTVPLEAADLCHQLVAVKVRTDSLLEATVPDRGGPNADVTRNYLALALARSSQKIIGRRATATAKGRFVKLVQEVYVACGLSNEGVEKIVDRTVTSLKAKR